MTIGEKIRRYRAEKNMTQEELANKIGTIKQTIYKYETGKVNYIPLEKLLLLSEALEIDPILLLSDDAGLLEYTAVDNKQYAAYNTIVQTKHNAKKEPATVSDDELSDQDRELISYVRQLSEGQKRFLLAQIKTLLESQG